MLGMDLGRWSLVAWCALFASAIPRRSALSLNAPERLR